MTIPVKVTCPLGSECEKAVEGGIERCAWYIKIVGKDPQSEETFDDWRCAMAWQPILLLENTQHTRGTSAAVESFRNEMAQGQQQTAHMLANTAQLLGGTSR